MTKEKPPYENANKMINAQFVTTIGIIVGNVTIDQRDLPMLWTFAKTSICLDVFIISDDNKRKLLSRCTEKDIKDMEVKQ